MQQDEFVRAALARLEMGPTDLGDALGKRNPYAQVRGWLTGKYRLDLEDTWRILGMCGWLTPDAFEPVPQTDNRLERIEEMVRLLLDGRDGGSPPPPAPVTPPTAAAADPRPRRSSRKRGSSAPPPKAR